MFATYGALHQGLPRQLVTYLPFHCRVTGHMRVLCLISVRLRVVSSIGSVLGDSVYLQCPGSRLLYFT